MNFRFQPFLFPSILVILSAVSFSPVLKAQDINNVKPTTTPSEAVPQPTNKPPLGTDINRTDRSPKPILDRPQESSTPAPAANCQGKTPSVGQPNVPAPSGSSNSPESRTPRASELMAPLEQEINPLNPSSPVPQSQPISPSR